MIVWSFIADTWDTRYEQIHLLSAWIYYVSLFMRANIVYITIEFLYTHIYTCNMYEYSGTAFLICFYFITWTSFLY